MDKDKILRVIEETFGNLPLGEVNQDTVNGWDSFGHLQLIMAMEKEFNIKFKMNDIPSLKSLEKIECILEKM